MDGVTLKESEEKVETLLGIKIKCDLEWTVQVKVLVDKLKKRLGGLAYLRNIMSVSDKKNIIEGIFNSVLCYCLPLFGGSSNSDLKALQMQQNKAARIALCLPPRSNRSKMYDKLKWLTVLQLVVYHTLLCVHRIRKEKEPEYLANIFCNENVRGNSRILVDRIRIELQRNSFTHRGAIEWNKLPPDLRSEPKLSKFKTGLKVWVAENVERFLP